MSNDSSDEHDVVRAAFDGIWRALELIAEGLDAAESTRRPDAKTPASLARDFGHADKGARIRRFLRQPDDGGPDFAHRRNAHWILDEIDVLRIRRRFA